MNGETISGENKQQFATQSVQDAYFPLYSVRISHCASEYKMYV